MIIDWLPIPLADILMHIQLKFFGTLKHDIGHAMKWPITTETTIQAIILSLIQKPDLEELKSFFEENGEPKRSLLIFLNDQEISALEGTQTSIRPADILSFIPVIHGGCFIRPLS